MITKDELIFVEAMGKEWFAKIPVGDIAAGVNAINALRTIYADTFGSHPVFRRTSPGTGTTHRSLKDELNDDIPGFDT